MVLQEPKVEFVRIDLTNDVLTNSNTCTNCANDDGKYTGGTEVCWGSMEVTECNNTLFIALS